MTTSSRAAHLHNPDLVRVTIEGLDEQAVLAFAYRLTSLYEATGPDRPVPVPGEPGISIQLYARAQLPTRGGGHHHNPEP
ncbi:DUF6207 family protein [Streptomyces europaeiscabiei]|uniref:DUF6207 family protein n=1 Tax=Streptomyces europaeiscabiei TaxID=146819 RepID=UPI0038F7FC8C